MNEQLKVLIVGGYGTFGGRLARLLQDETIAIVVAGRSLASAQRFCADLRGRAQVVPAQFDRNGDVRAQLTRLAPTIVVDASGPYQSYGPNPYRLIEACIELGVHYVDLADSAEFVEGIASLDESAKERGVFVLSGVSSFPVLTAAVVRRLIEDGAWPEAIVAGIAPSPHAGVGFNVINAIAGYAGKPIRVWRNGRSEQAFGLLEQRWKAIAPPGVVPLGPRMFSLVDVPDLRALPALWPELREVWVGAAPVPLAFHRMLVVLARLHRLRIFPSLTRLSTLMYFVTRHMAWGAHRGGMFVTIRARDALHRCVDRSWFLIAEGDSGPFIPSMAVESIIRKVLVGELIEPGARNAIRDIHLEDYERLFATHQIVTGIRAAGDEETGIFERVLGSAWAQLPEEMRALHRVGPQREAQGVATVVRGTSWLGRLIGRLIGLPRAGSDIPVSVQFEQTSTRERWTRRFGTREFHSQMTAGTGVEEGLLIERFGPFSLALALVWNAPRLKFIVRRWRIGPMPLPLWLAPVSETYETVEQQRFNFDVGISHRWLGLLVRYRGWLVPR